MTLLVCVLGEYHSDLILSVGYISGWGGELAISWERKARYYASSLHTEQQGFRPLCKSSSALSSSPSDKMGGPTYWDTIPGPAWWRTLPGLLLVCGVPALAVADKKPTKQNENKNISPKFMGDLPTSLRRLIPPETFLEKQSRFNSGIPLYKWQDSGLVRSAWLRLGWRGSSIWLPHPDAGAL